MRILTVTAIALTLSSPAFAMGQTVQFPTLTFPSDDVETTRNCGSPLSATSCQPGGRQ